jgi:hypothetical protein
MYGDHAPASGEYRPEKKKDLALEHKGSSIGTGVHVGIWSSVDIQYLHLHRVVGQLATSLNIRTHAP